MNLKRTLAAMTAAAMLGCTMGLPVAVADTTTQTETENNDTYDTATVLTAAVPMEGSLSTNSDVDWYKLELEQDSALDISFEIGEAVSEKDYTYWKITLMNANTESIRSYDIVGNQTSQKLGTQGLGTGVYYLRVEKNSSYSGAAYTLTANVTANAGYESEINDTLSAADELAVNTDIKGCTDDTSDKDYYHFTLEENSTLSVHFAQSKSHTNESSSYYYWKISLFYGDGNAITSYTIDGNTLSYDQNVIGLDAGDYYLLVQSGSNSSYFSDETYTLTANTTANEDHESEKNNAMDSADTLLPNSAIKGYTHDSSDKDYYKLALEESGTLNVRFGIVPDPDNSGHRWKISLMDENGIVYRNTDVAANESSTTFESDVELPAGIYYILVEPYSSYYTSKTEYTLTVDYTAAPEKIYETEANDTMAAANTVEPNTSVSGRTMTASDKDYYKLELTETGTLEIGFVYPGEKYFAIYLLDADGNTLQYMDYVYEDKTFPEFQVSAGTYYVYVTCQSSSIYYKDPYTVEFGFTAGTNIQAWESEPNDKVQTASTLEPNVPTGGRILTKSDKDYYKLVLDKSGDLYLHFEISDTSKYWHIYLTDETGKTTIAYCEWVCEDKTLEHEDIKAGTYYVWVESASSTNSTYAYTLTAEYYPDTYLLGDVNEDGTVDALDASEILVAAAAMGAGNESGLTDTQELAADVNLDDSINAADASAILSYAAAVGAGDADARLEDYV